MELNGANGLWDGDLATADLQPGHLSIIQVDRGMMMNTNEAKLVRSRCTVGAEHGGDRTSEPRMGCETSGAMPSAKNFPIRSVYRTGL